MRQSSQILQIGFLLKLSVFCLLIIGCSPNIGITKFDRAPFTSNTYKTVLAIDLRDSQNPIAGLMIDVDSSKPSELRSIILPFQTLDVESNRDIFSGHGSYIDSTLITYWQTPTTGGVHTISIHPVFESTVEDNARLDELDENLYLLSSGLEQTFIYKYPDVDQNRIQWMQDFAEIATTPLDAIAVALPESAEGREIRKTGQTNIPRHIFQQASVKYYPAYGKSSGVEALEVRYALPPTSGQTLLVEKLLKLFGALIIPMLSLFINFPVNSTNSTKTHKIILWLVAGLQLVILIILLVIGIRNWSVSLLGSIFDVLIVIIAGAVTVYGLWKKKQNEED